MLRLFIAIVPPATIRKAIAACPQAVAGRPDGRWLGEEQLHLTLVFLGECPPEGLMDIGAAIDGVAARSHGFRVTLRGFDAFSKLRRARVAFLRVTTGVDELCALAADLRLALPAAFRPAEGRRFRAHLTVARFRQAPPEGALQRVAEAFEAGGEWSFRVDSIQLVRSELSTAGARYSTLHTARLAAPGNPL